MPMVQYTKTPMGLVEVRASERGVQVLRFVEAAGEDNPNEHTRMAVSQLNEFFANTRNVFELALDATGTDFQKSVWLTIAKIPFGETRTYGELAQQLGKPHASRAVGGACGKNPLWLVVPCHRVVGANGKLTGYAGGINRKKRLLAFEKAC